MRERPASASARSLTSPHATPSEYWHDVVLSRKCAEGTFGLFCFGCRPATESQSRPARALMPNPWIALERYLTRLASSRPVPGRRKRGAGGRCVPGAALPAMVARICTANQEIRLRFPSWSGSLREADDLRVLTLPSGSARRTAFDGRHGGARRQRHDAERARGSFRGAAEGPRVEAAAALRACNARECAVRQYAIWSSDVGCAGRIR